MNSTNVTTTKPAKVRLTCAECGKATVRSVATALAATCKCGASLIDAAVSPAPAAR